MANSTLTGTWRPSENSFPLIPVDVISANFYVTEPGEFSSMSFNTGDWLVFIEENGNKNWYKATGGIVSFAVGGLSNAPDPGVYTKVRLDQQGRVIDGSYLEEADIPNHSHTNTEITDLSSAVRAIVGTMFQNPSNSSAVSFTFDPKTGTITGDVLIDEETIQKNEFGQLFSLSTGGQAPTPLKVTISDIAGLADRLKSFDTTLVKSTPITRAGTGIQIEDTAGGKIVSLLLDESIFTFNQEGALTLDSSLLGAGAGASAGHGCANHEHTPEAITGLAAYIKSTIKESGLLNLDVSQFPIDETTIIINKDGKLSAVAAKNQPHKHIMADITDLPVDRLVWASLQPLKAGEGVDFDAGKYPLSTTSVGAAIDTFNRDLASVDIAIKALQSKIGKVEPAAPPTIDRTELTINTLISHKEPCIEVSTKRETEAFIGPMVFNLSHGVYPTDKGTLRLLLDGTIIEELDLVPGLLPQSYGKFHIWSRNDFYFGQPNFEGFWQHLKLTVELESIPEGKNHILEVQHQIGDDIRKSAPVIFDSMSVTNPLCYVVKTSHPVIDSFVSGVPVTANNTGHSVWAVIEGAYDSIFAPIELGTGFWTSPVTGLTVTTPLTVDRYEGGKAILLPIEIKVPDGYKKPLPVTIRAVDSTGVKTSETRLECPAFIVDRSTTESRRWTAGKAIWPPTEGNPVVMEPFNSANPLGYASSIADGQTRNDFMVEAVSDYSPFGGADYSALPPIMAEGKAVRWFAYRVAVPSFCPNFYADIVSQEQEQSLDARGSLSKHHLFIGLSSDGETIHSWINGNSAHDGFSTLKFGAKNFFGLDLARSARTRRYITMGPLPQIEFSHAFIFFGFGGGAPISIQTLITSFEESVHGRN